MLNDVMMGYYRENKKGDLETMKKFGLTRPKWHVEDEILYPEAEACLRSLKAELSNDGRNLYDKGSNI